MRGHHIKPSKLPLKTLGSSFRVVVYNRFIAVSTKTEASHRPVAVAPLKGRGSGRSRDLEVWKSSQDMDVRKDHEKSKKKGEGPGFWQVDTS